MLNIIFELINSIKELAQPNLYGKVIEFADGSFRFCKGYSESGEEYSCPYDCKEEAVIARNNYLKEMEEKHKPKKIVQIFK